MATAGITATECKTVLMCTILLVASFTITTVAVQAQPRLEPGVRVRVWSLDLSEREINGRFVDLTRDSITLNQVEYAEMEPILSLPLTRVGRIDVSMGRNRLAIGASVVAGAALGAALFPALTDEPVGCDLGYRTGSECSGVTNDVVIGLAAGAIVGRLFSELVAKERWARVRMDVLLLDGSVRFHAGLSVPIPNVF
jgi:hypothetical protein